MPQGTLSRLKQSVFPNDLQLSSVFLQSNVQFIGYNCSPVFGGKLWGDFFLFPLHYVLWSFELATQYEKLSLMWFMLSSFSQVVNFAGRRLILESFFFKSLCIFIILLSNFNYWTGTWDQIYMDLDVFCYIQLHLGNIHPLPF